MGALSLPSSPASSGTVPLHGDGPIVSRNPATGQVLGEVPVTSVDDVRAAVARARVAQREWARVPVRERARRVLAFRDEITTRAEEIIDLIVSEGGKTRSEALGME